MVTECKPKPISMNFGLPRRREGRGSCVEGMGKELISQIKTNLATISFFFAAIKV